MMLIYMTKFGMLCKPVAAGKTSLASRSAGNVWFLQRKVLQHLTVCDIGHVIENDIMSGDGGMVIYFLSS